VNTIFNHPRSSHVVTAIWPRIIFLYIGQHRFLLFTDLSVVDAVGNIRYLISWPY